MIDDPAQSRFEALFGPEFGHGRDFDLAKLRKALSALGAPHEKLPPVFHVAGTNGKGSTIAFLRAIAEAAGLRVHAFTKPHLLHLRERFRIAGALASDADLIAAAERIAAIDPTLTQFDAQVAVALTLFAQTPADIVLIETGMGGRLDSTNVFTSPAASLITPIALDHQGVLGGSLGEIAAHKAGIIKAKVPAIIGRQPLEALGVLEDRAAKISAPLYRQGVEWDAYAQNGRLVVQTPTRALDLPLPILAGAHQIDNAGLAVAAMLTVAPAPISDDHFAQGVTRARWPGRMQALTRGPLAGRVLAVGGELWIDGAHNPHAAQTLADSLLRMNARRAAPVVLILGLRARKDWEGYLRTLAPMATHVISVPLGEDSAPPVAVTAASRALGVPAHFETNLEDAIKNAAQFPAPRVLISGSLLLAAEALRSDGALD